MTCVVVVPEAHCEDLSGQWRHTACSWYDSTSGSEQRIHSSITWHFRVEKYDQIRQLLGVHGMQIKNQETGLGKKSSGKLD
jgi:hypothetical protein